MNRNNENKANQRQKKQGIQLVGLLAGILFATIAGSGCSSMHKITSSYQASNENEIESPLNSIAASKQMIDANDETCLDTDSASLEQGSDDISSEDFFAEEEEDDFETESDNSDEDSQGLSQTVNRAAGDVFGNIASILSRYTELGNASNDTPQTPTMVVASNSSEIANAWQTAIDVNGNCVFNGSDITRLVANSKGLASLNHCSLVAQAGE